MKLLQLMNSFNKTLAAIFPNASYASLWLSLLLGLMNNTVTLQTTDPEWGSHIGWQGQGPGCIHWSGVYIFPYFYAI